MADSLDRSSLTALVPKLRRYARAALGDTARADACTAAALETVLGLPPTARVTATGLYRALYLMLCEETPRTSSASHAPITEAELVAAGVRALPPAPRHALLLERLEGLAAEEIAVVVGRSPTEVRWLEATARRELRRRLSASVLIVEDDFLIGDHLATVVEALGHDVIDVATNAEDAIAAAERRPPDLVLADVELGSATSGLETVAVIRGHDRVPAVYVTAFPERVLAAEPPEPSFVVPKPFDERRLKVAMTAALRPDGPDAGRRV